MQNYFNKKGCEKNHISYLYEINQKLKEATASLSEVMLKEQRLGKEKYVAKRYIFPPIKLCLGVLTFFGKALHSFAPMRLEIKVVIRGPRPPGPPVPIVTRVPSTKRIASRKKLHKKNCFVGANF